MVAAIGMKSSHHATSSKRVITGVRAGYRMNMKDWRASGLTEHAASQAPASALQVADTVMETIRKYYARTKPSTLFGSPAHSNQ